MDSKEQKRYERLRLARTKASLRRIPDYWGEFHWDAVIAQAAVSSGGWYSGKRWLSAEEIVAAEQRWSHRAYRDDSKDEDGWIPHQCGGCRFFAALGLDYGICCNVASPHDGFIIFEHGGCQQHSSLSET